MRLLEVRGADGSHLLSPRDTTRHSGYAPTARSVRERKIARPIPSIVGLGAAFACGRAFGVVGFVVTFVVTVTLTSMLVWWLIRRREHRLEQCERDGRILVADGVFEVDDGSPRDLNHRTGGDISTGRGLGGDPFVIGTGVFEATAASLRFTPNRSNARRRGPRAFELRWDDVASAEVVPKRTHSCVLFVLTRDGARHRFELACAPGRVVLMLAAASVAETHSDEPPSIRVGDRVRVRDGQEGAVVAVVPREHEPGHVEVFVRVDGSGVESWDSSEVTVLQ